MSRARLKPVYYDSKLTTPVLSLSIKTQISRSDIPRICEWLHSYVSKKRGASFYYPDLPNRTTVCRYEWHRQWKKEPFGIKLGFIIPAGDTNLSEIQAYITTNDLTEKRAGELPKISGQLFKRLQEELVETLVNAIDSSRSEPEKFRFPVFYLEMRPSIKNKIKLGNEVVIFPTKVIKKTKKRVSAVAVKVRASSDEISKVKALQQITLLCSLMALANELIYKTTNLPFRRNLPRTKPLKSFSSASLKELYPISTLNPLTWEINTDFSKKLIYVWDLYHKLTEENRNKIKPAVFAYYSGLNIINEQPTLAIVAFIAALSSIAIENKQKCDGTISCSIHGKIDFQHDIVGDRKAITEVATQLLNIQKLEDQKKLKGLIARIYSKHRSAYVHGATLKFEEFYEQSRLPQAFPTESEPVRDLFLYNRDLLSIKSLTRRILLEMIAKESGETLDTKLLDLDESKIEKTIFVESNYSLPPRRAVRLG